MDRSDRQALDEQARHLAYIIATGVERGVVRVEATEEGEASWVQQRLDRARDTGDFFENCTPGYDDNEGKTSERSTQNGFYGGGSIEFFEILEQWRANGRLEGMDLS